MTTTTLPSFTSLALRDIPRPDFVDLVAMPFPAGAGLGPAEWAREIFSPGSMPRWVRFAMELRQLLVRLIGLKPASRDAFTVREVVGEEALISVDDRHLDFRCGVGVDAATGLLRVTTVVRLKGWRGRLYFAPVRLAHPVVVSAQMKRAVRRLATA